MTECTLVTKSEFAARANISPGRVSQLIAEGKIFGPAIVGEGRSARLVFEIALAQYRAGRDPGQALGNGAHARTHIEAAPDLIPAVDGTSDTPAEPASTATSTFRSDRLPIIDPVAEQIQRERLEQEKIKAARMRREEAASAGRYMLAIDARIEMAKIAADVMRVIEGGMADLATAVAARFALPHRDVLHELSKAFRDVRARASSDHRDAAEASPAAVDEKEAA
ncbi:MAG: hypothetical protein BGN87_00200 [Rhizobiales bacterium 65-79]|nr:hypothetical protein [Hyphomicrobiales bacterium]OJU02606.1 MAG: hypothetical protein BGN87_00200 [Rhizobiales bacterium 65-79]